MTKNQKIRLAIGIISLVLTILSLFNDYIITAIWSFTFGVNLKGFLNDT